MQEIKFTFNGYEATVITPDKPNGEWVWKTEFLYAFDKSERDLLDLGYTRVCYHISDKYGSYKAVRLMRKFYSFVIKKFNLNEKCHLFGFSRGGLYAFNFALTYPDLVKSVYLDAPVLDMRSWPPKDSKERQEVYEEYDLTPETILNFKGHPVNNFEEYFSLGLNTLLVAGDADEIVPLEENGQKMIDYCAKNGIKLPCVIKNGCKHHPHSLEDTKIIIDFVKENK